MKATYMPVSHDIEPLSPDSPEQLAAILARYSRSNEGAVELMERHRDSSPDQIFQFVDYGHASIAGLTGGLAIAVDGVTMLLAAKFFEFAQMADGQESSTRYIPMSVESLPHAADIGIPGDLRDLWQETCGQGFDLYHRVREELDRQIQEDPESLYLPDEARHNTKLRDRLVRNYGLDRARYFLPLACRTNVAIVASARIWADIIKLVESLQWPEAMTAARLIREQLELAASNLVRHSHPDGASVAFVRDMLEPGASMAATGSFPTNSIRCECQLTVHDAPATFNRVLGGVGHGLRNRGSRYHHPGVSVKRQTVQTEWSHMAVAELRDLQRHRTGFRFSDWGPRGFYLPEVARQTARWSKENSMLHDRFQENYHRLVTGLARRTLPGLHAYGFFLGTQVPFEHTQQADKFLYEAELRTGSGAHFRYARHLRQAAELYFGQYPEARERIRLGNNEPE